MPALSRKNPTSLLLGLLLVLAPVSSHGAADVDFSILTYNTFLRAPDWLFRDNHDERAQAMPAQLTGRDVLVLQELFSVPHREQLLKALASHYAYHSAPLGADEFLSHNGGVMILSQWPITQEARLLFADCEGPDCLVKKGAVYVRLDHAGMPVHVFGLHLQAERTASAVRHAQLAQLQQFIRAQNIPATEPVIVTGDFNIDYYTDATDGEYSGLLQTLELLLPNDQKISSYDSASNSLLTEPYHERLDYILLSAVHRQPQQANSRVIWIRNQGLDLSDHHGIEGQLRFSRP